MRSSKGLKLLTRFVARDQQDVVRDIEAKVLELTEIVARFYALLCGRHWIFHEQLNVERVAPLTGLDHETAGQRLIEIYREPEELRLMIQLSKPPSSTRDSLNLVRS